MTKKRLNLTLSAETMRRLRTIAKRWQTTLSEVVAIAIDRLWRDEFWTIGDEEHENHDLP